MFKNRIEAGQKLAKELQKDQTKYDLVLAIPRGGVVVGARVAAGLDLPLDIIIPRKIGAPGNPEVAIGAVTQDGTVIYNEKLMNRLRLTPADVKPLVAEVMEEINRRMMTYRGTIETPSLADKKVILVDDGIATGFTVLAALKSLKNAQCKKITLAVPVAPPVIIEWLQPEVDHLVCLSSEEPFYAVGQFYEHFYQISDDEVNSLLIGQKCCNK